MNKLSKIAGVLVAVFAVAAFLAAAFMPAQAQTTVRVGKAVARTFEFIPVDIGIELGNFTKRGLDVKVASFRGDAKLIQAVAAGAIDVALGSGVSHAAAINKGLPTKLVATIGSQPNLMVLIVGPQGATSVKQLRGKQVGVTSHGALTDWLVKRVEENQGWPKNSITRVALGGFKTQLAALKRKQTIGFVWSADAGWDMEEKGLGKILLSFGDILPDISFEIIEAPTKFINGNPKALRAFLDGWFATVTRMKADKAFTVERTAKLLGLSKKVAARVYDLDMKNMSTDGMMNLASFKYIAKAMVADGVVSSPPDPMKWLTDKFAKIK